MSDAAAILGAFRQDLIDAGLVRAPSIAGPLPPLHIEPVEGAPAPGEREGIEDHASLVVSLFYSGELSESKGDEYRRRGIVDVRYRSANNAALRAAMALDDAIRDRLTTPERNYGTGFQMGAVFVLAAGLFGGFGEIARGRGVGFTHGAKYAIEVRAS